MTRSINYVLLATLACSAAFPGCDTMTAGPGRCVGAADIGVLSDQKVLLNLDKDGVALQGYDPVAYFADGKAVRGSVTHAASHRGAVYYFATAEHRAAFEAQPDKYAPEFGGWCAYAASINQLSPISPEYWEIVDGRLILQHNQRAWDLWHKDPANNFIKADINWPGLVEHNGAPPRTLLNVDGNGLAIEGYDPVSYFDGKPVKGDPALARIYQGATYWFTTNEHKNTFERDPAKYVPQFGGFCGYAASISKVSPVNPEIWQIVDGRVVLQHTPKAYDLFNQDVPGNYAKAEKNWPRLSRSRCK